MRPFRGAAPLCALAVLAAADTTARAAWNNVFQVSCFHKRRVAVAQFAPCCPAPVAAVPTVPAGVVAAPACPEPACPCPCPQPVCTTQYVQRCYYQPVTTYQQKTYYEP